MDDVILDQQAIKIAEEYCNDPTPKPLAFFLIINKRTGEYLKKDTILEFLEAHSTWMDKEVWNLRCEWEPDKYTITIYYPHTES